MARFSLGAQDRNRLIKKPHKCGTLFLVAGAGHFASLRCTRCARSELLRAAPWRPNLRFRIRLRIIIKTPPSGEVFIMVAGAGLEPTTSWLWATRAATAPPRVVGIDISVCVSFNYFNFKSLPPLQFYKVLLKWNFIKLGDQLRILICYICFVNLQPEIQSSELKCADSFYTDWFLYLKSISLNYF